MLSTKLEFNHIIWEPDSQLLADCTYKCRNVMISAWHAWPGRTDVTSPIYYPTGDLFEGHYSTDMHNTGSHTNHVPDQVTLRTTGILIINRNKIK